LSIFKTGNWRDPRLIDNPNLWVPCDEYYDPEKINILCDTSRGVPSAVPSISSSPTSSSPPTISSPPSLIPTSSSAPTLFPDCSCGVGEFKFELELNTDFSPQDTSWQIEDENGDILYGEFAYNEQFTIYNYDYCLPVGCYDFVIDDSNGDGICCGGYYKGSVYGWKEVFDGGQFRSEEIEHFCGEDLCT